MIQECHELSEIKRHLKRFRYGTNAQKRKSLIFLDELQEVSRFINNSETNSLRLHNIIVFHSLSDFYEKYNAVFNRSMDFQGSYVLLARVMNFLDNPMRMEWLIFTFPLEKL